MSWYALSLGFVESGDRTNIWMPVRLSLHAPRPSELPEPEMPARSLGTATADARWRWASPHAGCVGTAVDVVRKDVDEYFGEPNEYDEYDDEPVALPLRIAQELRAEMAEMAAALGRSEEDIWAEAAREWLMRRLRNDEPPPTTPAAAPIPNVRTRRLWNEIDTMLTDLRQPRHVAAPPEPTMPAA